MILKSVARILVIVTVQIATQISHSSAQQVNAVQIYERKCERCHRGQSGQFLRGKITLKDDILVGSRSGRSVKEILRGHYGVRLSPEEVDALVEALRKQPE